MGGTEPAKPPPLPYNLQWAREDIDKAHERNDVMAIRAGLQEVLIQVAWGVDTSPILSSIVISSETHDIPCKRQVYTIMTAIARKNSELTLLITNTLLKDCASDNPIIRGMALRAICDIEVSAIQDDLPKLVALGLADGNNYVRRMAVLATMHLHKVAPEAIEQKGIIYRLYELLRDRDPQIVCNALFALSAIQTKLTYDTALIHHLVNSLSKFSEWAQAEAMQVISTYVPPTEREKFDIMNVIDPFLSSTSPAVLTAAAKVMLVLTGDRDDLQKQVVARVIPKFVTHIHSSGPEMQFTLLKSLVVLAGRYASSFKSHIPMFFVNFADEPCVARAKFELLQLVTDANLSREVIDTTARYLLLEKPHTLREGVKLCRDLAFRLPACVSVMLQKFRLFFDMKRHNLINECLAVLPDLMRRLSLHRPEFVSLLPSEPPAELSGPALAAYAWVLGECGDRVPNAVYCLERVMMVHWEKQGVSDLRICLLNSLAKVFFISPGEARPVLAQALKLAIKDENPLVKARAGFIYQLLRYNLEAARAVMFAARNQKEFAEFVEDGANATSDLVFDEFNTFSVIYGVPRAEWEKKKGEIEIEVEEDEGGEEDAHKLEELVPITSDNFQAAWMSSRVASLSDSANLGFELDLKTFTDALQEANVGVMASGELEGGGSKVFAYGYIDGEIALIECVSRGETMDYTIKAESEVTCTQFQDFWLKFFE